jgi:hypothetical protein
LALKEEPRVIYRVVAAVDARHYVAPGADRGAAGGGQGSGQSI